MIRWQTMSRFWESYSDMLIRVRVIYHSTNTLTYSYKFYMHAGGTISKYYEYILITETYFSLLSSMVKGFFTNVGSDSLTSYTRT